MAGAADITITTEALLNRSYFFLQAGVERCMMPRMEIVIHRVYDEGAPEGYRVLVDRLWPRGLTKEKAALDDWCKDLAPSPALRTWFGHDPVKWAEFSRHYRAELKAHADTGRDLLARAGKGPLVLLYAAKDKAHTHALVLQGFLRGL